MIELSRRRISGERDFLNKPILRFTICFVSIEYEYLERVVLVKRHGDDDRGPDTRKNDDFTYASGRCNAVIHPTLFSPCEAVGKKSGESSVAVPQNFETRESREIHIPRAG